MADNATKPSKPVFCTAVLGTDGSGKSTLAKSLARRLSYQERTCLIGDRLEGFEGGESLPVKPVVSEELRRRMSVRAKSAQSLEGYKLPKLAELLLRDQLLHDVRVEYQPDSLFVDGMPALNLCAWSVLYRPEHFDASNCSKLIAILTHHAGGPAPGDPVFQQFPELEELRRLTHDQLRMPDAVLLLDVPPSVCMERIARRGEKRQIHETEEKLSELHGAYLLVCNVLKSEWGVPVLVLDGDRSPEEIAAEAEEFLRETRGASAHG